MTSWEGDDNSWHSNSAICERLLLLVDIFNEFYRQFKIFIRWGCREFLFVCVFAFAKKDLKSNAPENYMVLCFV